MDRRNFLQAMAAAAASLEVLSADDVVAERQASRSPIPSLDSPKVSLDGYTLICQFKLDGQHWKVYEDLRTRNGSIVFESAKGVRELRKAPKLRWLRDRVHISGSR